MKLKVADNIRSLVPYPPGKPLEELEREYGITGSIKLASNENALGPSPKAVAAIAAALNNLHRYPDGSNYYLTRKLSAKLGVKREEIVFGNGSNEVIGLLVIAYLDSGEQVITSDPTFLMYQKFVQARGGEVISVPMKTVPAENGPDATGGWPLGLAHDLETILARINEKTRMIFLDNPNNPTGTVIGKEDFESFLAQVPEDVLVVLDEAYVDFVDEDTRLDAREYLYNKTPVVSLRTFSKAYGLAGLRLGFGLMRPEIADFLHRVRQPFNVNLLAQIGVLAALDDDEHYTNTLRMSKEGIAWLNGEIDRLGCRPFATQTNFFLVDVHMDCRKVYKQMLAKGVIVRPMNAYGYPDYIRITVGTQKENIRFIEALAQTLKELGAQ